MPRRIVGMGAIYVHPHSDFAEICTIRIAPLASEINAVHRCKLVS